MGNLIDQILIFEELKESLYIKEAPFAQTVYYSKIMVQGN